MDAERQLQSAWLDTAEPATPAGEPTRQLPLPGQPRTLVDYFMQISDWPVSRKTALLAVFAALGVAISAVPVLTAYADASLVDVHTVKLIVIAVCSALCLWSLVCLAAERAGRPAPWTAYVFILIYGGFEITLIQGAGLASTPFVAMYPISVVVVALWYGETMAWFALMLGVLTVLTVEWLQHNGTLPYAPLVLARSLDAQSSPAWFFGTLSGVMGFTIFTFAIVLFVIKSRNRQQAQLREAHVRLGQSAEVLQRGTRLLRRYLPAQVVDQILADGREPAQQVERRKLSIFFSDLVGFTDIAEELEPEDLSRLLNEYFSAMTAIAQRHGGTVDELSGDAILIFFGAPHASDDKDHALRAARMAVEMQRAMAGLNTCWQAAGIPETLRVRMGINTGVVTVGNFGSPDRMKYAALGKHVNLAARLQAHCEPGKVLLSHSTWLLVHDHIACAPRGELQLKGINRPVMSYELAP
jgi:class 3 adenylate cyclase